MLLRSLYGIETDWITVITEEINISLATTFAQIYCQLKFVNDMTMEVRYLHIYSTTNLNDPVNSSSSDSFEKSANVVLECGLGADNLNKKAIKAIVTTVDDNCPIGNEQTTDFSLKMLEQSAPVVCNWTVGFLSNSKPYGLSFMLNEPFLLYCEATLPVNRQWNFFGFRNFCFTQPKPPEVQYRICTTEPLGTASSTMATVPHTHAQTTSEEYRTTTRSKAVSISSSVIIWFLILFTL